MKYPSFNVFPALGYWEIDGKPVSSKEAEHGLHPRAVWKETQYSEGLGDEIPLSKDAFLDEQETK